MSHHSALRDTHLRLGARMVEFGGFEMPLQYEGILSEHAAVRNRAGLFDVSHLGRLEIPATDAKTLDSLLAGPVATLAEYHAGYNLVLNEAGGIVDDVFVYRFPEKLLVVPNAANSDLVRNLFEIANVRVDDIRSGSMLLALSGPRASDIIRSELPETAGLRLHRCADLEFMGINCRVARTGYTGETTFEFIAASENAAELWETLIETGKPHGLQPAGLGARDLLRLEMGYPLHGQDITAETNPLEAGLGWSIQWNKQFMGKAALEEIKMSGPARSLAGLLSADRRIPRPGSKILRGGKTIGAITSGNFSPSLGRGIAMGYVQSDLNIEGGELEIEQRGQMLTATITKPPFIR